MPVVVSHRSVASMRGDGNLQKASAMAYQRHNDTDDGNGMGKGQPEHLAGKTEAVEGHERRVYSQVRRLYCVLTLRCWLFAPAQKHKG